MALFKFTGYDSNGSKRSGTIDVRTKSEALQWLERRKLKVTSLIGKEEYDPSSEKYEQINKTLPPERLEALGVRESPIIGHYIYKDKDGNLQISLNEPAASQKDVILFSRQFSVMIASGLPMIKSFELLIKQQTNRQFRDILIEILLELESGASLSDGLSKHPKVFDNLFVAMVRAGEVSGGLDETLKQLVVYIEKSAAIKAKVKSAMSYPILVFGVAVLVVLGLMIFVVPVFVEQFQQGGKELPYLTQLLVDISDSLVESWHYYLAALVIFIFSIQVIKNTENGALKIDQTLLKLPAIGVLLKKVAIGRFCSTLSNLLKSGVNLIESIQICGESAGNREIEKFILTLNAQIETGTSLSDALKTGKLFPDLVISMIEVGENTGALDEMLHKVSVFYEEEVDLAVSAILSMIEPALIIGVGGIIGFIVISLYLPIFDMASSMG